MTRWVASGLVVWALAGLACGGGSGTAGDGGSQADAGGIQLGDLYVTVGGSDPVHTFEVAVDDATLADLATELAAIGATPPTALGTTGAAPGGLRTLRVAVAGDAPAIMFYGLDPAITPRTSFAVLLGGSKAAAGNEVVVLSLPDVVAPTRVEIAGGGDDLPEGALVFTWQAAGQLERHLYEAYAPATPPPPPPAFAVEARGRLLPGASPAERQGADGVLVGPLDLKARLVAETQAAGGGVVIATGDIDGDGTGWQEHPAPATITVDVRSPEGLVLQRARVGRAVPGAATPGSITTAPSEASHDVFIKIPPIDGESGSAEAEQALLAASYVTYEAATYGRIASQIAAYDGDGVGALTRDEAVRGWADTSGGTRATIVDGAVVAIAHAAEHEAMLCWAVLPPAVAAAKLYAVSDAGRAGPMIATVSEALRSVPPPRTGMTVGGPLASEAHGAPASTGDVALGCEAALALADVIVGGGPGAGTIGKAAELGAVASELELLEVRYVDRIFVEWVAAMDALAAGTAVDADATWTEAHTKATILVDAMNALATRSEARFGLAHDLLAP